MKALSQKTLTPLLQEGFSKARTESERDFPVFPLVRGDDACMMTTREADVNALLLWLELWQQRQQQSSGFCVQKRVEKRSSRE